MFLKVYLLGLFKKQRKGKGKRERKGEQEIKQARDRKQSNFA